MSSNSLARKQTIIFTTIFTISCIWGCVDLYIYGFNHVNFTYNPQDIMVFVMIIMLWWMPPTKMYDTEAVYISFDSVYILALQVSTFPIIASKLLLIGYIFPLYVMQTSYDVKNLCFPL